MRAFALLGVVVLLGLPSGCAPKSASFEDKPAGSEGPRHPSVRESLPFYAEGPFVEYPAIAGGEIMLVPGFVVASLEVPFLLIPYGGEAVEVAFHNTVPVFMVIGYCVVGSPFWLVKKVTWDGPCAFGRFLNLRLRSPKGAVDFLVARVADPKVGEQARAKLEALTGEKPKTAEEWAKWWQAHRDEFDRKMNRVKPAPEPALKEPAAPAPKPAPVPAPAPAASGA
jgi:hypothetical protein